MTTTFERLRALLIKDHPSTTELLTLEAPLEALGIDSLALAELLFNVEDEFKITVPTQPAPLSTVGDLVAYIDGLVAAQNNSDTRDTASASALPAS